MEKTIKVAARSKPATIAQDEKFNFCIGRPWGSSMHQPDAVCTWMSFGADVHYGTTKDAVGHRNFVNKTTGEKHFIYKLVKVDDK